MVHVLRFGFRVALVEKGVARSVRAVVAPSLHEGGRVTLCNYGQIITRTYLRH
jgi:hypothetical protein